MQKSEVRGQTSATRKHNNLRLLLLSALCLLPTLTGCADKASENAPSEDHSEKALRDPMNYSPGLGTMDRGKKKPPEEQKPKQDDGLLKDLNTVFNP